MNEQQIESMEKMFPNGFMIWVRRSDDPGDPKTTTFECYEFNPQEDSTIKFLVDASRLLIKTLPGDGDVQDLP
jgi:hypothetical protein